MSKCIRLKPLRDTYAIVKLLPNDPIPHWADGEGLVNITRNAEELSIVCKQARVPQSLEHVDRDWSALQLVGPFAFGETGIVLSVIRPLSEGGLGIFVVSTYDGDNLLVKTVDMPHALSLLQAAGHVLLPL